MNEQVVRIEKQGRVARITLNRPARLNAINGEVVAEFARVLDDVEADDSTLALVITGEGRAFSAGADIAEMDGLEGPVAFSALIGRIQAAFDRLQRLSKPSIAAVNGIAFGGGCELALACDLRIAAEGATFGRPEIKIGILPGGGGTQRLPRLLPVAVAKQMILTGDPITAAEAYRLGLVNAVVPDGDAGGTATRLAETLAARPPLAVAMGKCLIDGGLGMDLGPAIEFERQGVAMLFGTGDRREGMRAFLEKRAPDFHGR
jgi:enoyl-CoA hydratase